MNHPDIAGFPRMMAVDALDVPSSSVTAKQSPASWDQPLPLLDSNSTAFSAILWAMIVVPDPLDAQASLSLPSASLPPLVVANLTYKSSSAPGTYALAANQQHQDSKSTTPAALQVHQLLLDIEAWNARRAAKPSSFSRRPARRQYCLSSWLRGPDASRENKHHALRLAISLAAPEGWAHRQESVTLSMNMGLLEATAVRMFCW